MKQENSNTEFYIYDQNGRLQAVADLAVVEVDGEDKTVMYPIKQYIWGPDRVLAQVDAEAGEIYYYLYNGHGDVVQIVDTNGNIKNRYDYDVWGNFLKKEETIENHLTYFGQTYDETTGLYYLRARYYDPTTGRFTQKDPAEDGYNWYVYGNNNPVMYVDPEGTIAIADDAAIIIVVGGTAIITTYAYLRSPEGQRAIKVGATAIYNGVIIAGQALSEAAIDAVEGVVKGASWLVGKAKDAWNVLFAKGGKQNIRSSEFQNVTDAELEQMYKDPQTSKAQKQKIKKEQKARKNRHSSQKK